MTINQLVKELTKREGLKKQVEIAQVREIVGHLSDLLYEEGRDDMSTDIVLYMNGARRAKRKKKKV